MVWKSDFHSDAVLRYHHEQGLTARRLAIEDVFVPYLLDT